MPKYIKGEELDDAVDRHIRKIENRGYNKGVTDSIKVLEFSIKNKLSLTQIKQVLKNLKKK